MPSSQEATSSLQRSAPTGHARRLSQIPKRLRQFTTYGMISHMAAKATRATLLFHEKVVLNDGAIVELIIWRLPRPTPDRRHGLKYRLYYGRGGKCLVRYDNEAGKGDHRHINGREEPYRFVSVAKLRRDFEADIRKYGGDNEEED
jgi:hypothetical protein